MTWLHTPHWYQAAAPVQGGACYTEVQQLRQQASRAETNAAEAVAQLQACKHMAAYATLELKVCLAAVHICGGTQLDFAAHLVVFCQVPCPCVWHQDLVLDVTLGQSMKQADKEGSFFVRGLL